MDINKIREEVVHLERKYDPSVEQVGDDVIRITLTDGQHVAMADLTDFNDIEARVRGLEKELDGQDYAIIG